VEGAVSLLTGRQQWRDEPVVSDVKLEVSTTMHFCNNPSYFKPSHVSGKVEDLAMDELVKGMQELKLNLAKLEKRAESRPNQHQNQNLSRL
jgi:hypothetical protein